MEFNPIRSFAHIAEVLLIAGFLGFGGVAGAQTGEPSSGVEHAPFTSQALPNDPERSLTAVVVELPPGAKAASHRHAGIVFAYVLDGTVRSQLDGGEVIEYRAGQSWVEPPGTIHTVTQNPAKARLRIFWLCLSLRRARDSRLMTSEGVKKSFDSIVRRLRQEGRHMRGY